MPADRLHDPIVFTANPLDRVTALRRDGDWIRRQLQKDDTLFLPFWQLKALIDTNGGPGIAWQPRSIIADWLGDSAAPVLLGLDDGISRFALALPGDDNPAKGGPLDGTGKFIDVRSIAPTLPVGESGILAQARSLLDWHARHGFCAQCGAPTAMREGGISRQCSDDACKASHFPRTDPVVIMLVLNGDKCLFGRQAMFPPGVYSALAGFIDQGECIEEAVRREVEEESGIKCGAVHYMASQPWPFPSSLMIGCQAEALNENITIDPQEIEDAQWFHRDQVREMVAASLTGEGLRMPPPLSLAHQLALRWLDED